MSLNFEKYKHDLFDDWSENEVKNVFIEKLQERSEKEKANIPKLLSTSDLKQRWNMNNRQSVYNQIKKSDFPEPVLEFSNGQVKLFLETEIIIYEIQKPWVRTQISRENYSRWIAKNVIFED